MFYDQHYYRHLRQPRATEESTERPRTLDARLVRGEHRGRQQWEVMEVPREWRGDLRNYTHTVVVNLPKDANAFEGELWRVRLQHHQKVRGILFSDGIEKIANPEGVPEFFEAGMTLIVADTPENEGTRLRRRGTLVAASAANLLGMRWLDLAFEDIERHVLRLVSGHLPRERENTLRLTHLHRTGPTWHAYYGDRLVELYRARV